MNLSTRSEENSLAKLVDEQIAHKNHMEKIEFASTKIDLKHE
jgi:hypothetical protein